MGKNDGQSSETKRCSESEVHGSDLKTSFGKTRVNHYSFKFLQQIQLSYVGGGFQNGNRSFTQNCPVVQHQFEHIQHAKPRLVLHLNSYSFRKKQLLSVPTEISDDIDDQKTATSSSVTK